MEQEIEKELDAEAGLRSSSETEKQEDIYNQLKVLHTDVHHLSQGVQEVEKKAETLSGEEEKESVVGDINSIISVHYDTLRWIERTASNLNDKLDHLEGLH